MAARLTPQNFPSAEGADRAALSGTFAASMERLLKVVAGTVPAPAALIAMMGDDRRTFAAGRLWHEWFAHDAGALIRAGVLSRTRTGGGVMTLRDARSEPDLALRSAAVELSLVSVAAVAIDLGEGPAGLLCVLDDVPRDWTDEEVALLQDFASMAATELGLRRTLSERDLREQRLRHDTMHDP